MNKANFGLDVLRNTSTKYNWKFGLKIDLSTMYLKRYASPASKTSNLLNLR